MPTKLDYRVAAAREALEYAACKPSPYDEGRCGTHPDGRFDPETGVCWKMPEEVRPLFLALRGVLGALDEDVSAANAALYEREMYDPLASILRSRPEGLCGERADHEPHLVDYAAVADGPMWCHADQSKRLPYVLERKS